MLFARRNAKICGPRPHLIRPVEDKLLDFARPPFEDRAKDSIEILDLLNYLDDRDRQFGNECWEWYGGKSSGNGYAVLWDGYKKNQIFAHRISWKIFRGPIPKGYIVSQLCETPTCTNPKHLICGPRNEIIPARLRRNKKTARYGDNNASSKLTDEDVVKIRRLHDERDFDAISQIASERGVGREHAMAVARHKRRKRKPTYGKEIA